MAGSVTNYLTGLQETINRRRARVREDSALRMTAQLLALMIVVVGILDVVSTNAFLAAGHREANALIAVLMVQLGSWWFVPKLVVHSLVALVILWIPSLRMISVARVCVVVYALIITSNMHLADWNIA